MSNSYGLEFEIAYLVMKDDDVLTEADAVKLAKLLAKNLSNNRLDNKLLSEMKEVIRLYKDHGWKEGVELNYLI